MSIRQFWAIAAFSKDKACKAMMCFAVSLLLLSQPAFATGKSYACGSVTKSFVKYETGGLANDFNVYYSVPSKARVTFVGTTDRAKDTLKKSSYRKYRSSSTRDKYELIAGSRARNHGLRYLGTKRGLKAFVSEVCAKYKTNYGG